MEKFILKNGIKLIYEKREGNLTSFCIGFEAGAFMERNYKIGTAHAVEHMIFKGTANRNEYEINKLCDEVFGFNNAMTNYPYSIYYGTTLSSEFEKGFNIYSDIILNPTFPEEGFKEEIDIICEELKEWKDDIDQYCEDELLYNSFKNRRLKNLIIGNEDTVRSITNKDIKSFYETFYCPENCIIAVISSLSLENVKEIVEKNFEGFNREYKPLNIDLYESNISDIFIKEKRDINGAKIQYLYPIHGLNSREINALKLFNLSFGEGTSSLLYDEIRTKKGLVYDIRSFIKNEKGIKLLTISLGTSKDKVKIAVKTINDIIDGIKNKKDYFNKERIQKNSKTIKLKRELTMEKSIELCKNLAVYEVMYNTSESFFTEFEELYTISEQEIINVINKVLLNPSIEIIKPV